MILRIFIVQPRFHVVGGRAWEKRPLAAKLARVESGNSDILDQRDQTKILSYVASFYSKSLAKITFFSICLLTIELILKLSDCMLLHGVVLFEMLIVLIAWSLSLFSNNLTLLQEVGRV